jgi:hypothetical protein
MAVDRAQTTWPAVDLYRRAPRAKAVLKMQINKSDRNDAAGIARIMQTGWFKEVFRFEDLRQATYCLETAAADYDRQCRLARQLAEEHFDAKKVVKSVLERTL